MKFRKKPVTVEAIQWTGANWEDVQDFVKSEELIWEHSLEILEIATLEGNHLAKPGDWIIRGIEGEFYPVKPNIFKKTYEKV